MKIIIKRKKMQTHTERRVTEYMIFRLVIE